MFDHLKLCQLRSPWACMPLDRPDENARPSAEIAGATHHGWDFFLFARLYGLVWLFLDTIVPPTAKQEPRHGARVPVYATGAWQYAPQKEDDAEDSAGEGGASGEADVQDGAAESKGEEVEVESKGAEVEVESKSAEASAPAGRWMRSSGNKPPGAALGRIYVELSWSLATIGQLRGDYRASDLKADPASLRPERRQKPDRRGRSGYCWFELASLFAAHTDTAGPLWKRKPRTRLRAVTVVPYDEPRQAC